MRTRLTGLIAAALLAGCTTAGTSAGRVPMPDLTPAAAGVLTSGMVASTNDAAVQAQSAAFGAFVKQTTGKETRPLLFPDYDSLASAISKGMVDVAFMPPLAFVRAQAQAKVSALGKAIRNGQSTYRSVLFGNASAKVKTLEELKKAKDLRAAWVDSSSATGYIFPKALLYTNNIDPQGLFVTQDFLGKHDAVCLAVEGGKADLGATFSDDPAAGPATHATGCRNALGDKADKLAIIAATENIPNDVLAVRANFPEDLKKAVQDGANGLSGSDEGKKTLKTAFLAEGFAPVTEEDFNPVHNALGAFKQ